MKLPNGDHAILDPRKLTDYSLNPDHDDGKHKAWLFQTVLGITQDNYRLLLDALREAAARADVVIGKQDKYGQRYVVDFEFAGPGGKAVVRSAWIIRAGEDVPRLVSCYLL
jgi:hypothetical protein